jgi:hypothetical protein
VPPLPSAFLTSPSSPRPSRAAASADGPLPTDPVTKELRMPRRPAVPNRRPVRAPAPPRVVRPVQPVRTVRRLPPQRGR